MTPGPAMMTTDIDLPLFHRGKVRDTYELHDDQLLMVATDRISAFDVILPNGIPDKGKVLTQLSIWWFSQTHSFQENHLVSGMVPDLPGALKHRREELAGRFMVVRKAKRVDFECVVPLLHPILPFLPHLLRQWLVAAIHFFTSSSDLFLFRTPHSRPLHDSRAVLRKCR